MSDAARLMCGIFFYDLTGAPAGTSPEQLVEHHAALLAPRGPDGASSLTVAGVHLLAFHRLAIINTDVAAGMQPFEDGEGTAMVCNGEIYNYTRLAAGGGAAVRSDVEVVLRAIVEEGGSPGGVCDAVGRLDGDFAFVCTDGYSVVAGRDPLGVRPLFYAEGGAAPFDPRPEGDEGEGDEGEGDEGEVVRGDRGAGARVGAAEGGQGAVLAFASEAKALIGAPGVARVRVFPPGHVYVGGRFLRYHDIGAPLRPEPASLLGRTCGPEEAVRRLLTRAVEKRLRHSDVPVGLLCSGGIDSAAVTAIAASLPDVDRARVRVFTMKYSEGQSDDAFYAGLLCRRLGFAGHSVVEFGPQDVAGAIEPVVRACETCDPNTVRAAIPMYLLARHIATHTDVKVVLSGEGADELFGGYGYFRLAPSPADVSTECARLLRNLHMFDLLRADRCFGAFGLEVRVPFLDRDLVDYVTALDGALKTVGSTGAEKLLLRDAFVGCEALVETRILDRPKEKFSDGTGFSYVPQLLRHVAGPGRDVDALSARLEAEAARYRATFARLYGEAHTCLVAPRVMPPWTDEARAKQAGGPTLAS